MKYFLIIISFLFYSVCLSAQEKHFIFIQSDVNQPFYVLLNGKLYSSSASGYVIIPKLAEGTYNLSIGFAQNAYPEQSFECVINKKDLGFNLKNFNENGWGLFNLQTFEVISAGKASSNAVARALTQNAPSMEDEPISFNRKKQEPVAESVKSSVDTTATVKNSTAEATPLKSEAIKSETIATNEPQVNQASDNKTSSISSNQSTEVPAQKTVLTDVKKVSETKGEEGVTLAYVDRGEKNTDTIRVTIPSSPAAPVNSASSTPANAAVETNTNNSEPAKSANTSKDPKFLDISPSATVKDSAKSAVKLQGAVSIMENSNCKNIATDDDYSKLRRKMAMESSDDEMIAEARKYYRNKCFTTNQIKSLSTLFLSDEGRYKFFENSLNSVADASQYYTLQSEFVDPAFATRFKSLLSH